MLVRIGARVRVRVERGSRIVVRTRRREPWSAWIVDRDLQSEIRCHDEFLVAELGWWAHSKQEKM